MTEQSISEYRREWMMEVLKLVHSRLGHLREIQRLTEEIRNALERNDRVSVQLLLTMRGEEMEEVTICGERANTLRNQFPEEIREEIGQLLSGKLGDQQETEAKRIVETVANSNKVLQQTVAIDKRMSKQIAGTDSFYDK